MHPTGTQKKGRSRRGLFLALVVSTLLVGGFGLWAARFVRQAQFNQQCLDAIKHNQIDRAVALVEAGADPRASIPDSPSPPFWLLLWAKLKGMHVPQESSHSLFTYVTVNANMKHWNRQTEAASDTDTARLTEVMLRHGADVDDVAIHGNTGLYSSMLADYYRTAEVFIAHKANVNCADPQGYSPLMMACKRSDLAMVRLLLRSGASANQADAIGNTPLSYVIYMDANIAIVQELLSHHADPNRKDSSNISILQMAKDYGASKIAALLRKYGAKE